METQTYTIQDLRDGKVAVINNGSAKDLSKVIKMAFPNDLEINEGYFLYYFKGNFKDNWDCDNKTDLPTQSVKVFLKEIQDKESLIQATINAFSTFTDEEKEFYRKLTGQTERDIKDFLKPHEEKYSGYTSLIGKDNINPSHYKRLPKETIERIGDNLSLCEFKGYLKGNILKYLDRYENKNGVEDLKKANWYLNKLIEIENEK